MQDGDTQSLLAFAGELADTARAIVLRYFRRPVAVEHKADFSPVTEADRAAERALRERVAARFPAHGFVGEEFGATPARGALTWVVDPIDGTKSFVTGRPLFGTLVALLENGRAVLGVVDIPALDERWQGAAGIATTANGQPCRTSRVESLGDATLYATSPDMFDAALGPRFERLSRAVRFRCFGGDCYAYALLASGHTDLVAEADMQPYDYLALVPVIEGAGGVVSDWQGRALGMESDGTVLAAANPALHALALAQLRD